MIVDQYTLRKKLRLARNALSEQVQQQAKEKISTIFTKERLFIESQHIAVYLANDGEIDPADIVTEAKMHDKYCYLPVINKNKKRMLSFLSYTDSTVMKENKFNIMEPVLTEEVITIKAVQLDVVLLPLTGFDMTGNRIGMGGGFYDATFAFKKRYRNKKPILIGLAHSCQQVSKIIPSSHDIALDGVLHESGLFIFAP